MAVVDEAYVGGALEPRGWAALGHAGAFDGHPQAALHYGWNVSHNAPADLEGQALEIVRSGLDVKGALLVGQGGSPRAQLLAALPYCMPTALLSLHGSRTGCPARWATSGAPSAKATPPAASFHITGQLVCQEPGRADFQNDLAISHERMGDLAAGSSQTETARQHFAQALQIREALVQQEPGRADFEAALVVPLVRLGDRVTLTLTLTRALDIVRRLEVEDRLTAQQSGWRAGLEQGLGQP